MPRKTDAPNLIAVIMPEGALQLEWEPAEEAIGKSRQLLQEELVRHFETAGDSWLLKLGFADKKIPLSPSVSYWRELATQFSRQLIGTPDLEDLRDKIDIKFATADIEGWLDRAPMMTGLDYLNADLLVRFWDRLHGTWRSAIQGHRGTVADFVRQYSPKSHDDKALILDLIKREKNGIGAPGLQAKSGMDIVKIRNILFQAYHKGSIQKISRGIYAAKPRAVVPGDRGKVVLNVIEAASKGIRPPQVAEVTGLSPAAVRPVIARLMKTGKIRRISRGLYGPPAKRHGKNSANATAAVLEIIE